MAGKGDGSFIIYTLMDTSDFTKGAVDMKSSFGKIASAAGKMGAAIKSAFTVKSKGADGLEEKSEEIKISVDDTAKSVEDGMQRINDAMSSGADAESFDTIQDKVDTMSEHLKSLEVQGLGFGDEEYDKAYQELVLVNDELKEYKDTLAETARNERDAAKEVGLFQSALNLLKMAAHAPVSMLKLLGNAIKQLPHATLNLVTNGLKNIANYAKQAAKKIGSGLVSGLKKAATAMLSFHKSTQKSNGSLGGGIKTILKYGLGIRSLYVLFNKIRNAIKEGFSNLFAESDKFKNSVDNLKASLLTLKNALATAFAPIVQVAIPYIQRLVEWIAKAADAFGQLMAALLGQKTYTKAIKQTTAALKEETKASNKQLSSLDKLNNLTSQSADDAGTGTGGMFEEVPISDKFKDIAKWLKDMWENSDFYELGKWLGEKLKSVLDNIPWDQIRELSGRIGKSIASLINGFIEVEGLAYSIGTTLAQALNTIFEFFNAFVNELHWDSVGQFIAEFINGITQNVDWELIYDTFVTLAKGLADALNSFNEWLDWESIASTVSNFFNTIIDTFYTFITETDWISLATNLGNTLSDAFTGIDWGKAGETAGEAFKAFFSFIATTIENIDWWAVGIAVKDYLVGIDWAGVVSAMFEVIGAALGGLGAFIGGLIGDAAFSAKDYFEEKIEEAGGDIVEGILVGIAEALVGIGDWIVENIFMPFMDGFCKAFGIASPSTVMEEQGGFIMEGLYNGISALVEKVVSVFTNIKERIINVWTTLKTKTSEIWTKIKEAIKTPINGIIEFINKMISGIVSGINSMTSALGKLKIDIPDWLPGIGGKSFGLNIPKITAPQIPYLATGAVIPPNAPFMAMLGDQKNGNNLEMPENLLRKIVREESGGMGGGDITIHVTADVDGYQLLNIMQKLDREYYKQHNKHAFA